MPRNTEDRALGAYNILRNNYQGTDDGAVVDLLTDLLHYATHEAIDFESCLRSARDHVEEETE